MSAGDEELRARLELLVARLSTERDGISALMARNAETEVDAEQVVVLDDTLAHLRALLDEPAPVADEGQVAGLSEVERESLRYCPACRHMAASHSADAGQLGCVQSVGTWHGCPCDLTEVEARSAAVERILAARGATRDGTELVEVLAAHRGYKFDNYASNTMCWVCDCGQEILRYDPDGPVVAFDIMEAHREHLARAMQTHIDAAVAAGVEQARSDDWAIDADGRRWHVASQRRLLTRVVDAILSDVFQGRKDYLRDHLLGVAAKVGRGKTYWWIDGKIAEAKREALSEAAERIEAAMPTTATTAPGGMAAWRAYVNAARIVREQAPATGGTS